MKVSVSCAPFAGLSSLYAFYTVSGVRSICSNPDLLFSVALPEALFILKAKILWPSFDL